MKIATLGFSLLLGASPLIAHADISGSIDIHITASAPGVEIGSVDVFYDQLSPYGVWVEESRVGLVFIPDQAGFVPYRHGHWAYTDLGMVWISSDPFGWATSHYGRWFFSSEFGRWVWVPDTQWGPSWVEWYEAEDMFGWVPLAPTILVSYGYEPPVEAWHYCPSRRLFDRNIVRYYAPRERVRTLHAQARPVAQRAAYDNRTIIYGPSRERLLAHRVAVQRQPIQHVAPPRQLGRPTPTEARRLTQRAQQRRPAVEQQNARRIEQRTEIRRVVEQRPSRTVPAPSRTAPAPRGDAGRGPQRPIAPGVAPRPDAPRDDANRPPQRPTAPRVAPPRPDAPRTSPRPNDPRVRDTDDANRPPQRPTAPRIAPPQRPDKSPPRVAPPRRPDQSPPRVAPPQRPTQPAPRAERAPQPPPRNERATPRQPRDEREPERRPPPARGKDRGQRR